ncbi:MAG: formate dehydrogenase accessory sulfurtransferase FdhD [Deltaproteobacteria bacterium]|nr:MAG: formate dehydrogenase accessory sulfurtransferase FdhD [Deltaproteobacteria bacterium]
MLDKVPILRVIKESQKQVEDTVVTEFHLTIVLNNRELVTLLCSPAKLDFLTIGFLYSEGLINRKDIIKDIVLDPERGIMNVTTKEPIKSPKDILSRRIIASSGGKGASPLSAIHPQSRIDSQIHISPPEVLNLIQEFVHHSELFAATGGVHSAALCDTKAILVFSEDIGRHNAIDKIFGECIVKDIPTHDRLLITSGRVSSEILLKVAKRNIPILISKSAPTNLGVKLANDSGITLIGFVREKRMNVYTHTWRLVSHGK